jgi:aminoglycoside phosphotransferase (APT) family kinase protein
LIATQFPQWKDLLIRPVKTSGWDNRIFHLGEEMLVRMPSAAEYEAQVEKEHFWLPKLAPLLPLEVPVPVAMGQRTKDFPWKWSIYRWIEGESAASSHIADFSEFATDLAGFLLAFQNIDSPGGPLPGLHSFYRGGALTIYDSEVKQALAVLSNKVDIKTATEVWETALKTTWHGRFVWVHGDVSAGNLLVKNGRLSAVIDFGQLAIGDPSCDLAIAWTIFQGQSREIFRRTLNLDKDTWARGRAWTLWKALVVAADFTNPNNTESSQCWRIIEEVLADHKLQKDRP